MGVSGMYLTDKPYFLHEFINVLNYANYTGDYTRLFLKIKLVYLFIGNNYSLYILLKNL